MPRFYKHKLLLDESIPYRNYFPRVNSRFDVKHIKEDLKKGGISDKKVYELAIKLKRLLIVFNTKDFKPLASKNKNTGIIGVSQNMSTGEIDKKLNSLLSKSKSKSLYGRFTLLSKK